MTTNYLVRTVFYLHHKLLVVNSLTTLGNSGSCLVLDRAVHNLDLLNSCKRRNHPFVWGYGKYFGISVPFEVCLGISFVKNLQSLGSLHLNAVVREFEPQFLMLKLNFHWNHFRFYLELKVMFSVYCVFYSLPKVGIKSCTFQYNFELGCFAARNYLLFLVGLLKIRVIRD